MKNFFAKKPAKFVIALMAGAFLDLAFAPLHFFIAAPIALTIFYFLLDKTKAKKEIFWLGFAFGFGHFLCGIYWIAISLLVDAASFAWLIPFALTLIPAALALYLALFAISYKFFVDRFSLEFSYQKVVVFAMLWVVFEILRSVLFSGFPWNLLGYVWMFDVRQAQLASIFGIYGLSFAAACVSLLPVFFLRKTFLMDKLFALLLIKFLIANAIFGYARMAADSTESSHGNIKLRLVQANVKQEMKWDAVEKYRNLMKHIELTNSRSLDDVTAVIWSETSVPYVIAKDSELLQELRRATPPRGVLITGALRLGYANDDKTAISDAWNSVFTLDKNGIVDVYDKHHLVPFGEYVPLQKYLPFVSKITDGAIGFSKGEGAKTIALSGFSFNPLICYEAIFSDEIIKKNSAPDLFVNLTNDAWFGDSSGPYQHLDMARMRSIEYGIPMARVANTGVSAFIDSFGRVVEKINLNQLGIFDVFLSKKLAPTVYGKYRYAPLILLAAVIFAFLTFLPKKHHVTRQNNTS